MRKLRLRPVSTANEFKHILLKEGINRHRYKANLSQLHDASVFLFKQILPVGDPRWHLAQRYADLKEEVNFQPVNFENALRANYASRSKGRNKAFGMAITFTPQVRQLARALKNIDIGMRLIKRKEPTSYKQYTLAFERTKSIEQGTDRRGVTGCPEALWQLQLWKENKFIGRIGFNFHEEQGKLIVSVANVQGASSEMVPGAKEEQEAFKKQERQNFGEFLIKKLKQKLGPGFEYKGIYPFGKNVVQYKMSFRKAKIPSYNTDIKTQKLDYR